MYDRHGVTEVGEDQTVMQYCACVGSETAVDILLKNGGYSRENK